MENKINILNIILTLKANTILFAAPSAPTQLKSYNIFADSAVLTWTEPNYSDTKYPITSFQVTRIGLKRLSAN